MASNASDNAVDAAAASGIYGDLDFLTVMVVLALLSAFTNGVAAWYMRETFDTEKIAIFNFTFVDACLTAAGGIVNAPVIMVLRVHRSFATCATFFVVGAEIYASGMYLTAAVAVTR